VFFDAGAEYLKMFVDHVGDLGGRAALGHGREADDIGKHHRQLTLRRRDKGFVAGHQSAHQ